jgi:hypothetical protein
MELSQLDATPGIAARSPRPIFQDLSLRRWYGFLALVGSAGATALFLTAVLWHSVQVTPELPALPEAPASQAFAVDPLAPAVSPQLDQQQPELKEALAPAPPVAVEAAVLSPVASSSAARALGPGGEGAPTQGMAPSIGALFDTASFAVLKQEVSADTVVYIGGSAGAGSSEPTP